jgi:S-formylglutathione hydrolase
MRKANVIVLNAVILLLAHPALPQEPSAPALRGRLVLEQIHSLALERNLLNDAPDRSLYVYLPPSYATARRNYPVVYFLHEYGNDYRIGEKIASILDRVFAAGTAPEIIVVFPDGNNRLQGSFYADSPAIGNFEQYITQEIVSYVDSKYRTLRTPASRGLVGYSMGGNGALRLTMKHPEVYGAVYALNACCMAWADEFSLSSPAWTTTLAMQSMDDFKRAPFLPRALMSIAAAWSAGQRPPFFADLPVRSVDGKLVPVEQVAARWLAGMPVALLGHYRDNLSDLQGIAFDVGLQDAPHIITGARLFSDALTRSGIEHQYQQYEGDHNHQLSERIATWVLPFLSKKLVFSNAPAPRSVTGSIAGLAILCALTLLAIVVTTRRSLR